SLEHSVCPCLPVFLTGTAPTELYPLPLHDALPIWHAEARAALNDPRLSKDMHAALARSGEVVAEGLPGPALARHMLAVDPPDHRSEEHTSELQSRENLVCRLLLEKKKNHTSAT